MTNLARIHVLNSFILLAATLGSVCTTWAEPLADIKASTWRFQVTPYVWMTSLDGQVRPSKNTPIAEIDKSFSEILKDLDAAAFVTGTARKGQFVFLGDFSYASVSDTAALPFGFSAIIKIRQTSSTIMGGHNWQVSPTSSIDALVGIRLWDIKANLQVPGLLAVTTTTSFYDPIVAARWRYDITPQWSTLAYIDAGGLGVGSDFTSQLIGSVNYQLKEGIHLSIGYRQLSVDYNDKGKKLDFTMGGPIVGATFRF